MFAPAGQTAEPAPRPREFQVGAYYFPNWHVDPQNEKRYGKGWTEWDLVKQARPRFPGHVQPRVPLWGCQDEADPAVMEKKIAAAADHALDYWIFDWYRYDDGPFLDACLEKGYFAAKNNQRVKFCCMWANHDWLELFPAKRGKSTLIRPGAVTRKTFDAIVDEVVHRYFKHPAHFRIAGCPYFSIYELKTLIAGLGGPEATRAALAHFRAETEAAGFPALHLGAVDFGIPGKPAETIKQLGIDSVTSYVWVHHVRLGQIETDYREAQRQYFAYWARVEQSYGVPYYPNITVGWDPSPRADPSEPYGNFGYPFSNTIAGNSPERFKEALAACKERLLRQALGPRVLNINAWNEWTEGSCLEPDTRYKMGYLNALRAVFG
jgi:hypothetical protein